MAEPAYDLMHEAYKAEVEELCYKPTQEFQEIVQDVLDRRRGKDRISAVPVLVPLSEAIDNECRRRGIFQ